MQIQKEWVTYTLAWNSITQIHSNFWMYTLHMYDSIYNVSEEGYQIYHHYVESTDSALSQK